jgi:hypothetical protein
MFCSTSLTTTKQPKHDVPDFENKTNITNITKTNLQALDGDFDLKAAGRVDCRTMRANRH